MYEEDGLNISCWRQISQMSHLIQHVLKHVHAAPSARKVERCIIYNETCIICCVWQQLPIFPENPSRSMMAGLGFFPASSFFATGFKESFMTTLPSGLPMWPAILRAKNAKKTKDFSAAHNKVVGLPNQFLIF